MRMITFISNFFFWRIPAWARKIFIPGGIFEYISTFWFKFITGTTELKRLKSGFLLKQLLDRFKNKTLSLLPAEQMMQIYSGHDITISGILDSLDVFEVWYISYMDIKVVQFFFDISNRRARIIFFNSMGSNLAHFKMYYSKKKSLFLSSTGKTTYFWRI